MAGVAYMASTTSEAVPLQDVDVRQIRPSWNAALIAASVAISLLGAFTTTQLLCQARVSRATTAVVTWTLLASLTFGFCSIWGLHMVATLACELDLEIGLDAPMTAISAVLAVTFTFLAISDVIWERVRQNKYRRTRNSRRESSVSSLRKESPVRGRGRESEELLLSPRPSHDEDEQVEDSSGDGRTFVADASGPLSPFADIPGMRYEAFPTFAVTSVIPIGSDRGSRPSIDSSKSDTDSAAHWASSSSRRDSDTLDSDTITGMGRFNSIRTPRRSHLSTGNPFTYTAQVIWSGLTTRNILKGLIWSFAVTCMHYLGIFAIKIPEGYVQLHAGLVTLSAFISWAVCCIACILMPSMETNLGQQLLFACVASAGVAAMHYTGMAATGFYTKLPPSGQHGYPTSLSVAIISIAIITCIAANGLLAHSATIARNKLAEIVRTRRKLWAAIAQKENAEAAAIARSEFIASASHEIRTPLHQLQGYSDLMARCPLPDDARLLLFAIQDATKTLSLITNNVLDWSRLEKGEAMTRPTDLDVRTVFDSVIKLLPRRDDDVEVELIAVVSPNMPEIVFLDETYLQRIVMNLVSNALKFTTTGYVSFTVEKQENHVIITVRDTGVGIPESFLPHLFEPFKQAQTLGAERGTGLGLSIVKQLLEKTHGTVEVESLHRDAQGVGSGKCGSKFVVRMPIQRLEEDQHGTEIQASKLEKDRLAYFGPLHDRVLEGLVKAWNHFDVDVIVQHDNMVDISSTFKYAWVDHRLLKKNRPLLQELLARTSLLVFVPFDTERQLDDLLGASRPAHFITFQRPWIFHQIMRAVAIGGSEKLKMESGNRTVRFASEIDVLEDRPRSTPATAEPEATSQFPTPDMEVVTDFIQSQPITVLLVEDNKINRRLGSKMLKTLGYDVILAEDGQEAVDLMHDQATAALVDVILMDQSMPRKDGLTATREIRALEEDGTVISATRWKDHPVRKRKRPILAVTAVVGPGHEQMCREVGTDAFLPKPLSLGKLREALEEYADGYSALDVQGI